MILRILASQHRVWENIQQQFDSGIKMLIFSFIETLI